MLIKKDQMKYLQVFIKAFIINTGIFCRTARYPDKQCNPFAYVRRINVSRIQIEKNKKRVSITNAFFLLIINELPKICKVLCG
jgi:hypothetical protein